MFLATMQKDEQSTLSRPRPSEEECWRSVSVVDNAHQVTVASQMP